MAQVIWFELNRWKAVLLFFLIFIFCLLNVSLYQSLKGRFDSVSDSQAHAEAIHKVRSRQILYRNYISKYTVIDDINGNDNANNKEKQARRRVRIKNPNSDPGLSNLNVGVKVVHREMKNRHFVIDPYLENKGHGLAFNYIMSNENGSRLMKNRYLHYGRTLDKNFLFSVQVPVPVIPGLTGCIIQNFSAEFLRNSAPESTSSSLINQEMNLKPKMKKPKLEIDLVPDCLKPLKKKAQLQKLQPARFMVDSQWNLIRIQSFSQSNFNNSANFIDVNVNVKVAENKNESEKQVDVKVEKDKKDVSFWKENVCYYRTFEKNPASKMKHDNYLSQFNNKKSFRYGPMIKILHDKTPLPKTIGFIETFCHSNGWMPKTGERKIMKVYEKYWTRVILQPELEFEYSRQNQENQKEKLQNEDKVQASTVKSPGLNILIIGLASLSRATFIREMPLSFSYLTNNLSAIEFLGFNTLDTVGSGSNPMATNLIPILTGLNYKEFRKNWPRIVNERETHKITKKESAKEPDFEPEKGALIWSKMAERGYRTSFSEDFIKAPCSSLSSSSSSSSGSSSFKYFTRLPPDLVSISSNKFPRLLHETIPDYLLEKNPLHYDFTVMANHLSRYLEDKFQAAECDCKDKRDKQSPNSKEEHEEKLEEKSPFKTTTVKPLKLTAKSARLVKAKKNAICWGYRLAFDVLMENLRETMQTLTENSKSEKDQKQPFWHMTWSSSLTRRAPTKYAKYGDKTLFETLKELKESGMLENTALLLLSDHGGSFIESSPEESAKRSESARSKSGQNQNAGNAKSESDSKSNKDQEKNLRFLESRLPMLYLALPKTLEKDPNYEMALKTLRMNAAQRLVTPFDLYPTLLDLTDLKRITEEKIIERVTENLHRKLKQNLKQNRSKKYSGKIDEAKLQRSSSLFLPISKERSCADVEIKPVLCTCANLQRINIDLDNAVDAHLNKKTKPIAKLRSISNEQGRNLEKRRKVSNSDTDPALINKMAHKVVKWISQMVLPYKKCHQLKLSHINQAQILQSNSKSKHSTASLNPLKIMNKAREQNSDSSKHGDGATVYELDIETSPRGHFYASVSLNPNTIPSLNATTKLNRNAQVQDSLKSPAMHIHILDLIRLERKSTGDETQEMFNLVASDAECVATLNIQHLCVCKKKQAGKTRMKMRRTGDILGSIINQILPN